MYSFIKPKIKPLFSEDTKLWLIFISAVTALMIGFSLFLLIESYINTKNSQKLQSQIIENSKTIKKFEKKIEFINEEKTLYTNITVNNQLLKDGVKNLLDLIPDPITLTNIKIEKNSLIIYGITPTKDVYNILLLPPLKSIFTQTSTNFYQMDNRWYRFESINTLKEEQ
jgi:Tfp pilus assembly protein PilN